MDPIHCTDINQGSSIVDEYSTNLHDSDKRHLFAGIVSDSYRKRSSSRSLAGYLFVFVHLDLAQIHRQT
ncbi:uncharacterized protein FFB20_08932 [Fusarium fujikuroi]|uniref:Uncharacterized protein n=2 Tax=Fusarium fujikuroi TaxID=5127 RepID=S0DLU0_GIBF5|nr:uncharacterized protein FFUJ_01106 [Fusarium fujikuroi IMI 58289]KLP03089.1 uncharacterized protein Y057_5495 [Fusarium fujikuroi]CCT62352.1 uncharacterized protein FFUJ_01106 [Fusarium fujikuroi IMI 58289]SCN67688.1 uncharacterized protein FFE2_01187 [Fusarium fujikuroi]SCN71251.1 uncharacterized protein FFC1_01183 [Fusarium fujikuroi]SCN75084.1 uncharacterized protein FFM5_01142 [Fusarium fujikuroi]